MSQLAQAVVQVLAAQADFQEQFPGDIQPDLATGKTPAMPYGIYTGDNADNIANLAGETEYELASFELVITAATREQCALVRQWVMDKLKPPSWKNASVCKVFWWRAESSGSVAEVVLDGAEEAVRQIRISVVGAFRAL